MSIAERLYAKSPAWLETAMLNAHAGRLQLHRYGRKLRTALAELVALERADPDAIRAYQSTRLRAVVRSAARSSYYNAVFARAGVRPEDVTSVDDLRRLPLLLKNTVRASGAELVTEPRPRRGWVHGHTSGTTGSPLSLWYDRRTCVYTTAVDWQQKLWAGMRPGDWIGMVLGRVIVPVDRSAAPFWRANHVQRQVWFSSFHLTDENIPQYLAEIRRRRLRFLEGYPSTLFILARYLTRAGETLPLQASFTSSETLHPHQRELIETAFAAPLFDFYGMAERVVFGSECELHNGKHLNEGYGITEIVDASGSPVADGEIGYVVGTSLHNEAMPMLRYRTSDMSAIEVETCSCGRTARRLRNVTTKAEDIIVLPDGRMLSPSILTHPFKPFDEIVASQIVQEALDEVHVRIVARESFTPEMENRLGSALRERLGPTVRLTLERVDEIPREPSGKFRWVVSKVAHPLRVKWEG